MGRARREGHWWYYLDDGLYGSYSGQLYDHARYPVESLRQGEPLLPSVLAGPTCDSIDVIAENLMLPQLKAGDLIGGSRHGGLHLGQRDLGVQFLSGKANGGGGQSRTPCSIPPMRWLGGAGRGAVFGEGAR
jgi:hypothetical protein